MKNQLNFGKISVLMFLVTGIFDQSCAQSIVSARSSPGKPAFYPLSESCQMGNCERYEIDTVNPILFLPDGALFKIIGKSYARKYENSTVVSTAYYTKYVFCSIRRPAVIDSLDGKLFAQFIAPNISTDNGKASEISYMFYFSVCHGRIVDSLIGVDSYARQAGYKIADDIYRTTYKSFEKFNDFILYVQRRSR